MGIESFINRKAAQTAVYWGNPQDDGIGGKTFDAPIETFCRWEEMGQVVKDKTGNEVTSRGIIYPVIDMVEEGMIYLGNLTDLTTDEKARPITITKAYIIKRFEKSPVLGSETEYFRKVFLTPSLSFGSF